MLRVLHNVILQKVILKMQICLYSGDCHDAVEFLEGFFVKLFTAHVFNTFIDERKHTIIARSLQAAQR